MKMTNVNNTGPRQAELSEAGDRQIIPRIRSGWLRAIAGGVAAMGLLATSAWAGPFYWNAATGSPLTKGPGIWDEGTNLFWSASPAGGALTPWVADSDAYFMSGGVSTNLGTNLVTVSGLVKVGSITQISNYTATTITNTTTNDIIQIDGAGITNGVLNGAANGNENLSIYAPVVLNTNITVNAQEPVLLLGGLSDGGKGYGIYKAGIGTANSVLRFLGNAANPTQPYTFTGPITVAHYRLQLSDPAILNSAPIIIGVPNSGGDNPHFLITEAANDQTLFTPTNGVQAFISRSSLTINSPTATTVNNAPALDLRGVNTATFNTVETFPSWTIQSGLFNGQLTFNNGNMTVYVTNFTRNPGTFMAFARNQSGAAEMYSGLGRVPISAGPGGGGPGDWNIVFVNNPPPLVGAGGPAGSPSISIWPWADAGDRLATYDSTFGLRPLLLPSDSGYNQETMVISNSMVDGMTNAFLSSVYYPSGFALNNNVSINSLCGSGSIAMQGTNTLTIVSGAIGVNAGMTLGATPNDGFLAFGSTPGYSYCQYARTLTVNSVITGTGGFIITQCQGGNNSGSVVLNGANTYTGITRLLANNTGLLTSLGNPLAFQNTTLDYNGYGGTLAFQSSLTSATFGGLEGGQSLALPLALTVGGDGDSTTYSGALSGTGSLAKVGPGTLTLTGASTYTGGTTLSAGQLNINYGGSGPSNSAIGTGPLTLLGGAVDNTSGSAIVLAANNAQIWNGSFSFLGSSGINFGTGNITLAGNSQVTINGNGLSLGGVIIGGGALTKAGSGPLTLYGANTYTGNTVISSGEIALIAGGALSGTPIVTVSNGAIFDVSGLISTFTLGAGQELMVSGTINGSVNGAAGAAIYPGTDGGYGTAGFNNNLTLSSGATANFDLGTNASGSNDLVVVNGNLTLNGNSIHIKAPSASASLAGSDYTLFTVGGSISGAFASSPVWDLAPSNIANFTVVTSGAAVKLHYAANLVPEGVGVAVPSAVVRRGSALITVTVTPGSFPVSSVTLNASPVGGPSALALASAGNSVYTNTVVIGGALPVGPVVLTASITDSQGTTTTILVSLTMLPATATWSGASAVDSNWSDSANWVGGVGPLSGDNVVFTASAALSPVVDQPFTVSSIVFSNNAGNFVITNANGSALTMAGGVTNNSTGSQTLNAPVILNVPSTFDTAAGNLTVGSMISGNGALTNTGSAALTLSVSNSYSGGTVVSSGTVIVADPGSLGSGLLTMGGGTISNNAGLSRTLANQVQLAGGGNIAIGTNDTLTLLGTISGNGSLTETGGGTLLLSAANSYSGTTTISSSTLMYGNNTAVGTSLLVLQGGAMLTSATTSPSWVVPNAVNLAGQASINVGSGHSLTFTGVITNAGGFILNGAGTVVMGGAGASSYSGGTVLNAPTVLDVENPHSPLGTGTLTLAGGWLTLRGAYTVALTNNVIAQSNTISYLLASTQIAPPGTLTLAGNISGSGRIMCTNNDNVFQPISIGGNNSAFSGTFDVSGLFQPTYGCVRFDSALAGSSNAVWLLENYGSGSVAGQQCNFGTGDFYMGALTGPGWLENISNASTVRLVIGGLNTNATFTGSLITNENNGSLGNFGGNGNFTVLKVGTGAEYFTGPNPTLTNVEVAGGAFVIGTTFTTIQAGAPAGQGVPIPVEVDDGATFGVIDNTNLGKQAIIGSLALGTSAGAGLLFVNPYAGGLTPLSIGKNGFGTLTNNGTCAVQLAGSALALVPGFSAPLISYSSFVGNGNFVLAPMTNGLVGSVTNDPANGGLILNITGSVVSTQPNLNLTTTTSNRVTTLNFSWPADHLGWSLQSNNVGVAAGSAWITIPGSALATNQSLIIDATQKDVFFRLSFLP